MASSTPQEPAAASDASTSKPRPELTFRQYTGENDIHYVMDLIDNDLSEPYSIFTYRYFLNQWPELCWLAFDKVS